MISYRIDLRKNKDVEEFESKNKGNQYIIMTDFLEDYDNFHLKLIDNYAKAINPKEVKEKKRLEKLKL